MAASLDVLSRTADQAAEPAFAVGARFDVFLSYNSLDQPLVESIATRLREKGIKPWLDKWYIPPGVIWQHNLEAALRLATTCAVFISPNGFGKWQEQERLVAHSLAASNSAYLVIPVLLPGLPDPFDPTTQLPGFLATRMWVDLRAGIADPMALGGLAKAIKGEPFGPPPLADVGQPPYRGLETFQKSDAGLFFGRTPDLQRLLEKLKSTRFLAVLGPSGSGKSSLVRAGLVPALANGKLPGSADWKVLLLKPTATPLIALATQLNDLGSGGDQWGNALERLDRLRTRPDALHSAIEVATRNGSDSMRVLLIVDQFEEIFTLCRDEAERTQFLTNLIYAATVSSGHCVVVLTLRADFYGHCAAYPELAQQLANHQALVSPIDRGGLRQVILGPAARVGLELEDQLVEAVLEDTGADPGALPLLEDVLLELWHRRDNHRLTLRAYHAAGRVSGALAKRADQMVSELSPADQQLARKILLQLIEPGDGTEDTRRRVTMAELESVEGGAEAAHNVLDALLKARLLTVGVGDPTGAQTIELAHEALIRGWPTLRAWVNEERRSLLLHRRVRQAASDWRQHGHDPSYLFGGARLLELQAMVDGAARKWTPDELAFMQVSRAQEAARLRGRYLRSVGEVAGGTLGISVSFGMMFGVQAWRINEVSDDRLALTIATILLTSAWNVPTGLSISLGLRLWRNRRARRAVMVTLIGGAVGGVSYLGSLLLFTPPELLPDLVRAAAAGVLLGAGLAAGAALGHDRRQRLAIPVLAGLTGMIAAKLLEGIRWEWPDVLLYGLILGGFSALGLSLTADDSNDKLQEG